MFPRGSMQSRFETIHVVVSSAKSFDRLCADFESIVPRAEFDIFGGVTARASKPENPGHAGRRGHDDPGADRDRPTPEPARGASRSGQAVSRWQPSDCSRIIGRHTAASLYLPLRVLVYEDERGRSAITYDQPSSLIGQFQDEQALDVARLLDGKLCEIASKASSDEAGLGSRRRQQTSPRT